MRKERNKSSIPTEGISGAPATLHTAEATSRHLARIKARNKRITLLTLGICLCFTLLLGLIAGTFLLLQEPEDDGRILANVIVGNVNIGGMTKEEATSALRVSLAQSIATKDMTVELPGAVLTLSPEQTGAALDLEALVEAAYAYGRSGSTLQKNLTRLNTTGSSHTIALLGYMELDLDYIRQAVTDFCNGYNSQITQPSTALQGDRPVYTPPADITEIPDEPDTSEDPEDPENPEDPEEPTDPELPSEPQVPAVTHQVLTITMGTPQLLLDSQDMYNTILDAYSLFTYELSYEAPDQIEPELPDVQAIFQRYCVAPVDAFLDPKTYQVIPETVGYGFDIIYVQSLVDNAEYGQQIQVTLDFLHPDITANTYNYLFQDVLSSYTSRCDDGFHAARNKNLAISCEAINGYVIKAGESFDFNAVLGIRTTDKGYQTAPSYSGSSTSIVGGGISQTASALHFCALLAGLQINEQHHHRYTVPYSMMGTDAAITYGSENLVFTNTTSQPIRIQAVAQGSNVTITLYGTDERDYRLSLEAEILETTEPGTIYQHMSADNIFGYLDGQVLTSARTGYRIRLNLCRYDKETGEELQRQMLYIVTYEKRDQTVVKLESSEDTDA